MTDSTTSRSLSRRQIVTGGALALTGSAALAAPAIAQGVRTLRMATSWPLSLGGLGSGAQRVAQSITDASGGRLKVDLYGPGELVAPLAVHDAVMNGEAEMYHAAEYYWQGKHRGFNFFTTVPLGMTHSEQAAWISHGGGQELWDELNAGYGVKAFACGSTGVQMGGWFDRRIESMDDFQGLTMRMPGLGAQVLATLQANPVMLPGGGIVEALFEKSIDATEWVGPYNDLQFGFQKLLTTYMYPGFHEPATMASTGINLALWESLAPEDQALIEMVCEAEMALMSSDFYGNNGISILQLVDEFGVRPTRLPDDVWTALAQASADVVAGVAEDDDLARRIYESYSGYQRMLGGAGPISQAEYLSRRSQEDLFQLI
ncbi:MAG: TRAP transporter substrate-binding protein [Pseudomonadota bacterium]